jgi:hypothetical protein
LDAQNWLGDIYQDGIFVKQDFAEAARWYLKAAEQGHEKAQYSLGIMYRKGLGVSRDEDEAAKWIALSMKKKK